MFKWIREIQCWHARLIEGPDGRPSLAKSNLWIGAFIGSIVVIKSMLLGKLTTEMFAVYLLFCSGQHAMSKWLDTKLGVRE